MAPVKFTRVVSFSSEDPNQPAENLIKHGTYRKWRCKTAGEPKAWAELQLEKMCTISSIDIGNHGAAFIEVLVGRSGCSEDDYKVLLNSASFMSPIECRNEKDMQRVRMFGAHELNKTTLTEKWDRIRIVCTQPFNKQLQYGISFITVNAEEEQPPKPIKPLNSEIDMSNINLGMFKLKEKPAVDPIVQGSLFSRFRMADINSKATSALYDSPSTSAGAIRAASQSLASVALQQSEREAVNILRKSPVKADGRPDIKLEVKPRSSRAVSPVEMKQLSSRKTVESDRVIPPPAPTPTLTPKQKKPHRESPKTPKSATKRKIHQETASERPSKKKRTTKPFNRLMDGVVFVVSGFQNPLRSQLRDKLLAMGAKYKPDWNNTCTHLICAFFNTPKFQEVKGKGKIVTKEWVEACHAQRKRLPWRRFYLDKKDRGEESEDEIWEGPAEAPSASTPTRPPNKATSTPTRTPNKATPLKNVKVDNVGNGAAAVKACDDDEDYGGSTEVDEQDTDDEIEMVKKKNRQEQEMAAKLASADG